MILSDDAELMKQVRYMRDQEGLTCRQIGRHVNRSESEVMYALLKQRGNHEGQATRVVFHAGQQPGDLR